MAYPYNGFNTYIPQQQPSFAGYAPPPLQPTQPQSPQIRLVTSKEEVVAAQIPFDGSTSYFVDTSNGRIYSKAFDFSTGTAPIVTYTRETESKVQFATIDDINALRAEIEALKKPRKAAKQNDTDE